MKYMSGVCAFDQAMFFSLNYSLDYGFMVFYIQDICLWLIMVTF